MIEWKKVFYYAIVPALIAGLFAIAPKLYEIATEPNAELKYNLIKGPEIQVENGFQSIFSVVVQNTGKKALTNVSATLNVKNGKFESYKVQDKNGIKLQVNANESKIEVLVDKLFASESFSTSILMLSSVPDFKPEFSLRSGEVLGQEKATNLKKENSFTGILGAMLSALSVFITAIYITSKVKNLEFPMRFMDISKMQSFIS